MVFKKEPIIKIYKNYDGNTDFCFDKYIKIMLNILPNEDLLGISAIKIIERFSNVGCIGDGLGCYIPNINGKKCILEISLPNIFNMKTPKFWFDYYPEIAALRLSRIIFHEIGHHVGQFKRHGIKDQEIFAEKYAIVGFYYYIKIRYHKIMLSYWLAKYDIINFTRTGRVKTHINQKLLRNWFKSQNKNIRFP